MTTTSNSRPKALCRACGLLCLILTLVAGEAGNNFAALPGPRGQQAPTDSSAKPTSSLADGSGQGATNGGIMIPETGKAPAARVSRPPNSLSPHPENHAALFRKPLVQPVVNTRPRPALRNARTPGPIRSDRIGVAGKSAAGSSQSLGGAQHVRVSSTARPLAAPANMVRHRSPNPAVVTGRVSSVGRNTGGIDGSRIKGKT